VLGFQDETWWTRLAQPDLFAWAGEQPLRLYPNEHGGKEALACYGLLRFVEGRPVSQVTEDFLGGLCRAGGRLQDPGVLPAGEGAVAEPDRAEVAARQAGHRRARPEVERRRG
jgi:hypothetical protein